jgi:hypothetical protein
MWGFKSPDAAARFCREHGELRNLRRPAVVITRSSLLPSAAPVSPRRRRLHSPSCRPHEDPGLNQRALRGGVWRQT